jgi:hypothetical protein
MHRDDTLAGTLGRSLDAARVAADPFRHWLLRDVLPEATGDAIAALPFAPTAIADTAGKRETHNSSRVFFSPENRDRFPVCRDVAALLQDPAIVAKLQAVCGVPLGGSYLRIEYCQDSDGFWLEPHTDISAKLFTMLVYLSHDLAAADWGTDIYDADLNPVGAAPGDFNRGLIFIPGSDTWHGFRKRPIVGVRRSIIVNYVRDDWRSRHELAFPDQSVG